MIRLTPLREIDSVQALLKAQWLDVLLPMIRRQFIISDQISETLLQDLQTLDAHPLKALIPLLWDMNSVEDLERWIAEPPPALQDR